MHPAGPPGNNDLLNSILQTLAPGAQQGGRGTGEPGSAGDQAGGFSRWPASAASLTQQQAGINLAGLGLGVGAQAFGDLSKLPLNQAAVAHQAASAAQGFAADAVARQMAQLAASGNLPNLGDADTARLQAGLAGNNPQVLQQLLDFLQGANPAAAAQTAVAAPLDQTSLVLWAQLLQATNGKPPSVPERALQSDGYSSQLKRQREDIAASFSGIVPMDRDRLEEIRRESISSLSDSHWQQPFVALQQLASGLQSQQGSGAGALSGGESSDGMSFYNVKKDSSKAGHWTDAEKDQLVKLVHQVKPTSAQQWEVIADYMGKWSPKGASAERMYRTLTDPGYYRATNKHGRRLNARTSIPMYIKAVFALLQLPGHEGNLTQISDIIAKHAEFAKELDWTPRPGAKTYPRWKDALLSCFKEGRYPYLEKTTMKNGGSTVYRLRLDALKMDDVQKYVKYLEIPANALPPSLSDFGAA